MVSHSPSQRAMAAGEARSTKKNTIKFANGGVYTRHVRATDGDWNGGTVAITGASFTHHGLGTCTLGFSSDGTSFTITKGYGGGRGTFDGKGTIKFAHGAVYTRHVTQAPSAPPPEHTEGSNNMQASIIITMTKGTPMSEVDAIAQIRALEHEMFNEDEQISVRVCIGDSPEEVVDVDPTANVVQTLRRELGIKGTACKLLPVGLP